jgi:Bacterial Ig-like domain (group 3)
LAGGLPTPSGSVIFVGGSTVLGTANLSGGTAQFTISNLTLGPHSIQAFYENTGAYIGSESAAIGLTVQPDSSTIIVTPSANPSPPGHALTLTANVIAAPPGSGTPTGTVTFYNGKKKLGTVTLSDGMAALKTTKLTNGAHTISAVYDGDPDFNGKTSAGLREVIKQRAKPKKPTAYADAAVALIQPNRPPAARQPAKPAVAERFHDMALETLSASSQPCIESLTDDFDREATPKAVLNAKGNNLAPIESIHATVGPTPARHALGRNLHGPTAG